MFWVGCSLHSLKSAFCAVAEGGCTGQPGPCMQPALPHVPVLQHADQNDTNTKTPPKQHFNPVVAEGACTGQPGEGKPKIWVIARQHPGESMAEWFTEGFLRRLLDPHDAVARRARASACFFVVSFTAQGIWLYWVQSLGAPAWHGVASPGVLEPQPASSRCAYIHLACTSCQGCSRVS